MTPEQLARRRVANMTPEQLERQRERKRLTERRRRANMTPEQRERKRIANMTPEQRERLRESKRKWHQANREKSLAATRRSMLWRQYRLTPADVDRMRTTQGGACACCGDVARLVVDHDHTTGKVRALLCHNCNTAIGMLKDDPERAISAAEYLAKHQRPILALVA